MLGITRWTRVHALILLLASGLTLLWGTVWVLAAATLVSFVALFALNQEQWNVLPWGIGPANWATALRLCLLLLLLLTAPYFHPWWLLLSLLAVASLDGLDGFLARKTDSSSLIGEYFDKETDAFYVLAVGHILLANGYAPVWVLGLGWIRYVYVLVLIRWQSPTQKEARFPWGRIIAVVVMIGLPLCLVIPSPWRTALAGLLGVLLLFSFGRSFVNIL